MARHPSWEKVTLTALPRRFRSEATRLRKLGSPRGLSRRELQKRPGDRQQRPGFLMPGLQGACFGFWSDRTFRLQIHIRGTGG